MIKKIIFSIYLILISISHSQILNLPIKNKHNISSHFYKNLYNNVYFGYKNGFDSKIYLNGNIVTSNKIDIFICNHINFFDFFIPISILDKSNKNTIFLYSKYMDNLLFMGNLFKYSNNISLKKNINEDQNNILKNIKNLSNNHIIFLYPEGTRLSQKKILDSKKYSKDNDLHSYDNLLYPKIKGLYTIIKILNKSNKLGNIIDCTIKIDGLNINDNGIQHIIKKDLGKTHVIIKNYKARYFEDYKIFKKWFIQIWDKKEEFLINYKKYKYTEFNYELKVSSIILTNLILTVFLLMVVKLMITLLRICKSDTGLYLIVKP